MTGDDLALVAAASTGDAAAFDALVRRHTAKLYRVALRIVGDPADAEDVVQEAWVSAWRSLAQFRGEAAPTTWLYRVVTNAALAHLRRRKPTVPLEPEGQAGAALTDAGPTPEQAALRREKVDAALHAISLLEPSQRVPLVLRELEGMSYEEVAAVLEVSVPALRSRLHRARVALLAKLEELR
ncbi:RNA polymerase sigma factor [Allokutzneria albata]|uniref:RNA polymerase sigma-70 factor, ECF subfamily n=1 Tax=Allokutzneria albata TaxID=211114 RepID=A0A1G9VM31_ALLAB|nr:sigma-70 family RNA polymerase sigma factor [Allokutzneria albata]SDM73239.1 RNA polymerase sigma-70 factor, ECF subfamily [Allokutzneria albata]